MSRRDQRGVALIFVLWLLVLLGAAAAEVASRARSEALILSSFRARTVGRYAAESGILRATTRIEALLDSARVPVQRVAMFRRLDALSASLKDIELGGARFGVAVVDLNARIDLNRADDKTLRGLFTQFTPGSRAEAVVAALRREPLERLGELTGPARGLRRAVIVALNLAHALRQRQVPRWAGVSAVLRGVADFHRGVFGPASGPP